MSSTSLSEYECGNYYTNYVGTYRDAQAPWYSTTGHPLVYYAQMPPTRQARNRRNRKGDNCFVKAFKWYTQEHVPTERKESPEMPGFAMWLDTKYGEFLRDSSLSHVSRLKLEMSSTLETQKSARMPCPTKRFTRVQSPWRKRKRATKEAGDVTKQKQSLEIIMQPKDFTCPNSELCHFCPTNNCNKSTVTLNSDTPGPKRPKSLKNFCHTKESSSISATNELVENKGKLFKQVDNSKLDKTNEDRRTPKNNISCQCPELKVTMVDAQTQYEIKDFPAEGQRDKINTYNADQVPKKQLKLDVFTKLLQKISRSEVSCQCSDECVRKVDSKCQHQCDFGTQPDNTSHSDQCKQEESRPTSLEVNRTSTANATKTLLSCKHPGKTFVNDVAQTSDHSIRLDKEAIYEYPLFMKIICADKLNKE